MRRGLAFILGLAILSALGYLGGRHFAAKPAEPDQSLAAVQRIDLDVRVTDVMDKLRTASREGFIAITNVGVIDPVAGSLAPEQTVLVRGDRIEWVGAAGAAPPIEGALVIDGTARFLSPGLTDMHVHTEHMGQHVLRLAAGVTGVRDMAGFPWLLRTRDAINSGAMIGATTYVAGTIIADHPLFGYAVIVKTLEEARQTVRNQAACGYSFIKVHNRLKESLFNAAADEAQHVNLDLVGHVPHDISLLHAIESGHMRTIEHLKGFLIDQTLLPSDEPYAPALDGAEVWLTPTLYTRLDRAHGEAAHQLGADPRQRYNPRNRREAWLAGIPPEGSKDAQLYDRYVKTQATVMARLLPLHPRWLVGTDAAGYSWNVAGFATLDEMVLMHQLGLSNADIIRAATSEPAIAMRRPGEFGRIVPGERADLVLLDANPLEDIAAYQANFGVMARGRWYDRASLDAALTEVAAIYDTPIWHAIDSPAAEALAYAAEARAKAGYVFEDMALVAAADELDSAGAAKAAAALRNLVSAPSSGVCAVNAPGG